MFATQDKSLTCADCGQASPSLVGARRAAPSARRSAATRPAAAIHPAAAAVIRPAAGTPRAAVAAIAADRSARCSPPRARTAARRPRSPSAPRAASRSTARTASRTSAAATNPFSRQHGGPPRKRRPASLCPARGGHALIGAFRQRPRSWLIRRCNGARWVFTGHPRPCHSAAWRTHCATLARVSCSKSGVQPRNGWLRATRMRATSRR
jgi:hypothetical protein